MATQKKDYTGVKLVRGGQERTTSSIDEEVKLRHNGWAPAKKAEAAPKTEK